MFRQLSNLSFIQPLRNLKELELDVSDKRSINGRPSTQFMDMSPIRGLNLTQLKLSGFALKESDFSHIASLWNLQTFHLQIYCDGLTGSELKHLRSLEKLETLRIVTKLTDEWLKHISALVSLKELTVLTGSGSQVTAKGIRNLYSLDQLKKLHTKFVPSCMYKREEMKMLQKVVEGIIPHFLVKFQQLEELKTSCCSFKDLSFVYISSQLRVLDLSPMCSWAVGGAAEIKDKVLSCLSRITQLVSLNILGCESISDVGLVSISAMTTLEKLYFGSSRVTDEGVASLTALMSNLPTAIVSLMLVCPPYLLSATWRSSVCEDAQRCAPMIWA